MRKHIKIIGMLTVAAITLSVSGSAAGKAVVFVSIVPQKYFVQQIGKDLVDIQVMVQPGASPAAQADGGHRQNPYLFLDRCAV